MIPSIHVIKILQLLLFLFWCLRFKPTLKWSLVAASIPAIGVFIPGSYESGDFTAHIVRAMDMYASLQHGVFPVRWASLLYGGYGYPLFSFAAVLPYYALSLLHFLGFSFVFAMKLYLFLVYLGSAAGMWWCAFAMFEKHHARKKIATISSVFYVLAPYALINLHFRAAAGELAGFALFPAIIGALLLKRRIIFCVLLLMLILSHPGISLLGIPWIALIMLVKKYVRRFILPTLLSIGLSAFYLFPSLLESRFTEQVVAAQTIWWNAQTFQPVSWLFIAPWRRGFLLQGHYGEVANILGYAQIAGIFTTVYLLIRKKISEKYTLILILLLLMIVIGVFMMLPISAFVWNTLPFIRKLQFPSRMMFYLVFAPALLCGLVFSMLKIPKILISLLFISLGWTMLNWTHRAYHPEINDQYLFERLNVVTFMYERLPEATPLWEKRNILGPKTVAYSIDMKNIDVIEQISQPTKRTYHVVVQSPSAFHENTLYFPGWIAYIDNKPENILITENGTMSVNVPAGEHILVFTFEDTPIRGASNILSLVSFFILIIYLIRSHRIKPTPRVV